MKSHRNSHVYAITTGAHYNSIYFARNSHTYLHIAVYVCVLVPLRSQAFVSKWPFLLLSVSCFVFVLLHKLWPLRKIAV